METERDWEKEREMDTERRRARERTCLFVCEMGCVHVCACSQSTSKLMVAIAI